MNYMRVRAGNAPSWVTQQFPEDGRDKKRPWSDAVGAPHLRKSGNQYTTTRKGIQICTHFQVPDYALCPDWQLDNLRALMIREVNVNVGLTHCAAVPVRWALPSTEGLTHLVLPCP